jgi:hypothetical protein
MKVFSIIGLLCGNKTEITFFSLKFINFFKWHSSDFFSRFFDTHKNVNNTFIISHSFLHFRKRTFIDNSRSNGYFFFFFFLFTASRMQNLKTFHLFTFFSRDILATKPAARSLKPFCLWMCATWNTRTRVHTRGCVSSCQFHQHFTSSFCGDIFVPKNYKAKL